MEKIFFGSEIKKLLTISNTIIDNVVFRLHYKVTSLMLFAFSILVTLTQYFGNPIFCITKDDFGKHEKNQLINTYCWIESTFTLPKALTKKLGEEVPHPGVDRYDEGDEVIKHAYYQWVCFVLFLQGCMFHATRVIWKIWEEGKMKTLVTQNTSSIKSYFVERSGAEAVRFGSHSEYAFKYFTCEILNFVNVVGQIYFIDKFLGGEFTTYGTRVFEFLNSDQENREDPMVRVFPRMTKCLFRRFGPSGGVQEHDALCILPINILNEKLYVIIWVWFVILALLSGLAILYRIFCILSPQLRFYLTNITSVLTPVEVVDDVLTKVNFGDWFVLYQLGANIDNVHYRELMEELSIALDQQIEDQQKKPKEIETREESEV